MLTHRQIWNAIDRLAAYYDLTPSGLARRAGLDPTAFNKSKRTSNDGKPRWPSTESLAKVLEATGASLDDFATMVREAADDLLPTGSPVPLIGFAEAGAGGFFDDGGFPVGSGWDEVRFPEAGDGNSYALEISGDSMAPVYRDGDIIIVSPGAGVRRGDRVVVKTLDGEVMAKVLHRKTAKTIELYSFNPNHPPRTVDLAQVAWIARIMWVSQ
jgi:phage repressor protein C with HTH and peptisase S24 domain